MAGGTQVALQQVLSRPTGFFPVPLLPLPLFLHGPDLAHYNDRLSIKHRPWNSRSQWPLPEVDWSWPICPGMSTLQPTNLPVSLSAILNCALTTSPIEGSNRNLTVKVQGDRLLQLVVVLRDKYHIRLNIQRPLAEHITHHDHHHHNRRNYLGRSGLNSGALFSVFATMVNRRSP
ncbi:hypothetical protein BO78DRAFT_139603 [Aspergillus sclerotiicarbonarius CBS 121057]|uniref:Uncharacterized protein n=1 Tax=Aspergillus sclerotiicarbonarius (strain CBS 121057 / IBT 28362) TaxID=1448318 RepID=A0A319EGS7_ASPSB|nr:hypothetical protein BO78DRAFT_139603 [Aspergillus sclerotiicarbonarius CBS 121057]